MGRRERSRELRSRPCRRQRGKPRSGGHWADPEARPGLLAGPEFLAEVWRTRSVVRVFAEEEVVTAEVLNGACHAYRSEPCAVEGLEPVDGFADAPHGVRLRDGLPLLLEVGDAPPDRFSGKRGHASSDLA